MHVWSKYWLIFVLILALSACGPIRQVNLPASVVPTGNRPAVTDTITPIPTTPTPAPPIYTLKMINAKEGWAWTSSNRLLRTTDGGQTWMDRTPEGQVWPDGFFGLDAQTAWLSKFDTDNNRFDMLHTGDGGLNWTDYPNGPSGAAGGIQFTDALNGWAAMSEAGAGNIYYSLSETQDGGKTWAPIPVTPPSEESGLPPGTIHLCNICADSFYYDPARILIVHGDEGSMQPSGAVRIQTSFDLGKTWKSQSLPLPGNSSEALVARSSAAFFDGGNGLLAVHLIEMDNNGNPIYQRLAFYATRDGGGSWVQLPGILENIAAYAQLQIVSPKDIFVPCGNMLCASHDGAQTWSKVTSNLDFTQSDNRSVGLLDFQDANTGWVSIMQNESSILYKTSNGGVTWTQLNPILVPSAPVTTSIDTSIPTPTMVPTPTFESTSTPNIAFDPGLNAFRIRFAPNGTWIELNDSISANTPKRFILSAMQGQVMSVSIPQGPAFSLQISGIDKKTLNDPLQSLPFWRGILPSTQDYIITVDSQADGPFTLRIAVNPQGQATQNFVFSDPRYLVALSYTDEFAPTDVQIPVSPKGIPLLTLAFIDPTFYSPRTNLSEAYLMLAATTDPVIVSTCTQPSTQVAETLTGQVTINNYAFTRSEFSGAAAGNRYDQVAYRTIWENKCFEVISLIHSTNIGNYPAGTVVEFDRAALLGKFEAVLDTFLAK